MVESYNIGIDAHDKYAQRIEGLREYEQSYPLSSAQTGAIASHTSVLKLRPDMPHIILLMRLNKKKQWALFGIPSRFYNRRHSTSYILSDPEELDADIATLSSYVEQYAGLVDEEEGPFSDGQTLMQFISHAKNYNLMVDEVHARMKQFMQG